MDEVKFDGTADSKQGPGSQQEEKENKIADANQDQSASKQVQEKIENKLGEEYAGIKSKDLPQSPGPKMQSENIGAVRLFYNPEPSGIATEEMNKARNTLAQLIDVCEYYKHADPRLAALAQTQLEMASFVVIKLLSRI